MKGISRMMMKVNSRCCIAEIPNDQDALEWAGKYKTKENHIYVATVYVPYWKKKSIENGNGTHNDNHVTETNW